MITYEAFKEIVKEEIGNYLGDDYKNADVRMLNTKKVNRILTGITVMKPGAEDGMVPILYLEDYYDLLKSRSLDAVLRNMADDYKKALNAAEEMNYPDFESIKDTAIFQLVNTENNKELLKSVPHREFLDLSIIYRWVIDKDEGGMKTALISNALLEAAGINEDDLYKWARKNTPNILPPVAENMSTVINSILGNTGDDTGIPDNFFGALPMWIISNPFRLNGAISMFYGEVLHKLADRLNDSLFILPSSIHEVIAIPASGIDPEALKEMVMDINRNEVSEAERLSDNIYYYDKNEGSIVVVNC